MSNRFNDYRNRNNFSSYGGNDSNNQRENPRTFSGDVRNFSRNTQNLQRLANNFSQGGVRTSGPGAKNNVGVSQNRTIICFYCGRPHHTVKECQDWHRDTKQANGLDKRGWNNAGPGSGQAPLSVSQGESKRERAPEERYGGNPQIKTINLNQAISSPTIKINAREFKKPLSFLLDTGATVSLVRKSEISPSVLIDSSHIVLLKGITSQLV